MYIIKDRRGLVQADTPLRDTLMDQCWRRLSQHGFRFSEVFYADHISLDEPTNTFILYTGDRIIFLGETEAREESLEDD